MATQWYYSQQGQRTGPVSDGQLKQLALSGQLQPSDLVWKEGTPNWIRANEVAGLFPAPSLTPPPFTQQGTSDRARHAYQRAGDHTEKITSKLWFLDLKFGQFFTPKLIGIMWAITLCLLWISFAASVFWFLWTLPVLFAAVATISQLLLTILAMVLTRVLYETFLVIFRIAEHTEALHHLENLKYLENIGK